MRNTPYTTAGLLAAVRVLREQGHDVDENNNTHVSAYMALREAPPHGVTGERLVERIQWLQTLASASVGERVTHPSRLDFWAVPRRNFPNGVPAICRGASCSAEDVAGCECPNAEFFFIDQAIPRSVLGPDVKTCSCTVFSTGVGPPATGDASATGDAPATGDAARDREFEERVHSIWAEFASNPWAQDRRRFRAQTVEASRRSRRRQIADEAERELAETAARHIADEARYLADEGASAATGEPDGPRPRGILSIAAIRGTAPGSGAAPSSGAATGDGSATGGCASAATGDVATTRGDSDAAPPSPGEAGLMAPPGLAVGDVYEEACENGDCGLCDACERAELGLMIARDEDLFDDHNHNPDFEHEEVPQWALDQWDRETRERQEGVASSATGGGASAATGDGSATGGGASAATGDECDADQEALDAARADKDKWEWGSRVQ